MKRILIFITILISIPVFADNGKLRIAVFDPVSNGTAIDEGTKIAIREIISSSIVNTGKYDIVERSLLEKVMQEQSFSNSGAVDDNDATEIGKLAGANKIVLSVVTLTGGRNMLSVKMIDVKTASVERQKVKVVSSGDLLDIVESIALDLIDATGYGSSNDEATMVASSSDIQDAQEEKEIKPMPRKDEVVFYLPAGYNPKKEKAKDCPFSVILDKETIGSGTLGSGFTIRVPNSKGGIHKLVIFPLSGICIGSPVIKVDFDKFNFVELQIYRNMGSYEINVREQKMIK